MTSLQERLASLSPQQRRLLEKRLQQAPGPPAGATIPRRPGAGPFPLSTSQRRQWFLQQLAPDNPSHNRFSAYRLQGDLDQAALAAAIDGLAERHPILRTTYHLRDGEPVQMVQPWEPSPLPMTDLSHLPPAQGEAQLQEEMGREAVRPFDLSVAPLWHHHLYRLGSREHVLLRVVHHIASDRWSVGILQRELSHLYRARLAADPPELPALPIQYADYAVWQGEGLSGPRLEKQLAYWRGQLAGAPRRLTLPTDAPRAPVPRFRGAKHGMTWSPEKTAAFKTFCRGQGVTPFMALLAVFNILLHRYSGQSDLLVGVPTAGRTLAEIRPLVGLFINTLVIRTDLSANPSFLSLLDQVRRTTLDAQANQELPFEKLVEALQPEREPGLTPLVQVLFDYLNTPMSPLVLPGLAVHPLPVRDESTTHDLSLHVHDETDRLQVTVEYDVDLYDPPTIRRMLGHFHCLLESALAAPQEPIAGLNMLEPEERQQVLVTWSGGGGPEPAAPTIPTAFVARAAARPDAAALVAREESLTYAELDRRSNQVARYLGTRGIGRGERVALCLERSPAWIVALLGVLKSGAAYVALDPATPPRRLAHQLQDSAPALVLTQRAHGDRLPPGLPRLLLDGERDELARLETTAVAVEVQPDDPAYIVYTSGSSGRPKGVIISHGALAHFTRACRELYGISTRDRVLQFASPGFDTAVEEIFPTLTAGAALVLRPAGPPDAFAVFGDYVAWNGVTVLDLPTAFWHSWVQEMERGEAPFPPTVRLLIVGGEAARLDLYRRWRELVDRPEVRWINTYGPSEATVVATAYEPTEMPRRTLPIGRPLPYVRAYVLDGHGNPSPIGVPGRLHLGGPGLAAGYLNQPALSAERFRVHPDLGAERLYDTGDRVRWLPDGNLAFLGREDNQVKVRGVRVELEEVEAVLVQHPHVVQAAVTPREGDGGLQLVAWVVLRPDSRLSLAELRDHCASMLPAAMQPGHLVVLPEMPLTPGGKIDRPRLTALADTDRRTSPQRAPTTALERLLALVWAELLDVSVVGLEDDFFGLGGHSLLAVRLVSRIAGTLGVQIPLRAVFATPTLAGMVAGLTTDPLQRAQLEQVARITLEVAELSEEEALLRLQRQKEARA